MLEAVTIDQINEYSAGWLSPEGKYYLVDAYCHTGKAVLIVAELGLCGYGENTLFHRGWLRVREWGETDGNDPTQSQIDMLNKLLMLAREGNREAVQDLEHFISSRKKPVKLTIGNGMQRDKTGD